MRRDQPGGGEPARWGGRLFLAPGVVLYLGTGAAADRHAHHAVQLVWAADAPVTVRLPDATIEVAAALVPAGVAHAVAAHGRLALLLIERHGPRGVALDDRARAALGEDLGPRLAGVRFPGVELAAAAALAWCDDVLVALGVEPRGGALSGPCRRALASVEAGLQGTPRLADAARAAGLSPTRLTHVFAREVGIPFRRFVLWARIKHAVRATQRGANATEAALDAGFSDSAHLSRTFRAMFGLPPSLVLPRLEIIGDAWTP